MLNIVMQRPTPNYWLLVHLEGSQSDLWLAVTDVFHTPLFCCFMSSGTFCSGNLLAQSSSCRSRCWEGLEDRGKCRDDHDGMFDRHTWGGLGQEWDWCTGSRPAQRWGWDWDCSSKTALPGGFCQSPRAALRCQGCCWAWTPSLGALEGGCAGLGAHPAP